jgi:hypothetical protein
MTATDVLTDLRTRGLRVWGDGGALHVAPRARLADSDRAAITAHKSALLTLLADVEALERDGSATQLRAIAATLTPAEHERLRAEAAAGDRLAELVTAVLATPLEGPVMLRCVCGGATWWPEPAGGAEWCIACGARSPVSIGGGNIPF